jgi:hypothetical protein
MSIVVPGFSLRRTFYLSVFGGGGTSHPSVAHCRSVTPRKPALSNAGRIGVLATSKKRKSFIHSIFEALMLQDDRLY